jgi:hypothetical protein
MICMLCVSESAVDVEEDALENATGIQNSSSTFLQSPPDSVDDGWDWGPGGPPGPWFGGSSGSSLEQLAPRAGHIDLPKVLFPHVLRLNESDLNCVCNHRA